MVNFWMPTNNEKYLADQLYVKAVNDKTLQILFYSFIETWAPGGGCKLLQQKTLNEKKQNSKVGFKVNTPFSC